MKFRLKIILCTVWLLALALGLGGGLLICQSFSTALERERSAAVASYQMTLNTLQMVNAGSVQKDPASLTTALEQIYAEQTWSAVRLRDRSGVVFASGEIAGELTDVSVGTDACVTRICTVGERYYLQISGQMTVGSSVMYLDIACDVTQIYADRTDQLAAYTWIFLITILLGALFSWGVAWVLTRPLDRLSRATRAIASGDLSHRVRPGSRDELGMLSRDFNTMAHELEKNVHEIQQNMERQEQFMGSFAHELKTPMTAIIGYADLLRTESLNEEESMNAANYIFSEGKRLEALSLKLLDLLYMNNQALPLQQCDVQQMIGSLIAHLRPVYQEAGIKLQNRSEPGLCMLEPDLVRSLLTNLVDNARKALDNGGNIYVISDWWEGCLRIRVLDNGRGMPPDVLEHLTEAFYRVDKSRSRAQGGAGLGLTLCQRIVQLHRGTIDFSSREGNGTCVTVVLKGERL